MFGFWLKNRLHATILAMDFNLMSMVLLIEQICFQIQLFINYY